MKLYDKKYVYFEWNAELEGKKGFVADDICELTNCVLGGDFHHTKVRKSLNSAFPFKDTNNNDWLFFYYDPNYEVKKAYNEGKKLQWKYRHEEQWKDWDNELNPTFFDNTRGYELRVKPDQIKHEIDYDRYLTNKEFAMWLAKGNGQFMNKRTGIICCNHVYITDENKEIDHNFVVRRWEDKKWYDPTYNYCFVGIRR